ncbi:cement 3B variant 3 [Schistosoma japonicum]|nr:cement 3B variant 3 [Schistosoma japonicum]
MIFGAIIRAVFHKHHELSLVMGLEESKIGHTSKLNCNAPNLCFFAPISPGRIIHQCTLELWKKSHRELFNFSDKVMVCTYQVPHDCTSAFCLTRQNIVNFRKSCSVFSLRKRREYTKMAEHFEYNHIPAHLSSIQNLHFKAVLDLHSGLAVVHLARDMITQFALVDLRINKFLGSFGRQTIHFSPESTIGKISPDGTHCLVRLPWSSNKRVYILKLYNLRNSELVSELPLANSSNYDDLPSNTSRLPLAPYQENNRYSNIRPSYDVSPTSSSITADFGGNIQNENQLQIGPARSSQVLFAFDPRFVNSRIAITNVDFPQCLNSQKLSSNWVPGIQATISLVKLPTWECLGSTNKLCSWSPSSRHGSPFVNNPTYRDPTRRRRSSDANHLGGLFNPNSLSYTFPHIMSIFYSRDGYFLFAITTESRNCRCSIIGNVNHSVNSLSSDLSGYVDDVCNPLSSSRSTNSGTEGTRSHQRVMGSAQGIESNPRYNSKINSTSPMLAPTLPGCTTLWLTIFNSDTLERLRILRFDRSICPIHTCPTNYLPVMSRCGSRIALITRQAVGFYNNTSNQNTNINSREYLLSSCKTLPVSLRHSIPSISVEACSDPQWMNNKGVCQEISKENSGKRTEFKKQQPFVVPSCLFTQPRNLNLSHHLSTSLPSPLSKIHLSSTSSPFRQITGGCSSSELSVSSYRPTAVSFESSFIRTQCNSPGSSAVVPTCTSSSGAVTSGGVTTVTNSTAQIDVLLVYQLPPPPKLQALVRQRIRQVRKCFAFYNHYLDLYTYLSSDTHEHKLKLCKSNVNCQEVNALSNHLYF